MNKTYISEECVNYLLVLTNLDIFSLDYVNVMSDGKYQMNILKSEVTYNR